MRIVICGSVALPVPPPLQGGTERIAYYQAKGLAEKGHEVILIAARGSKPGRYRLVEIGEGDTVRGSTREDKTNEVTESSRNLRKETVYLSQVQDWLIKHHHDYDLVLNNMRAGEAIFLPLLSSLKKPVINVMHLPLFDQLASLFDQYKTSIITISNAQRKPFPQLHYIATIYNGVEVDRFSFNDQPHDYLLMMGSITPHKNQGAGINVAQELGTKLILAGKIGDLTYYAKEIAPRVDGKKISYIGEIGFEEKVDLYKNAKALLFPILWEEPFGLVMIEAMACGTPVVAFNRGAIPEVVVDGKTGFILDNENAMVEAVKKIDQIERADCRSLVEQKFTVETMVAEYEKALFSIIS